MFGSHALEIGIGLTLFFLLVSLICSALREAIETLLKSRARDLERGIRVLLDDPTGAGLAKDLFDHGQISSLFEGEYDPAQLKKNRLGVLAMPLRARGALPSYIPAEQFATALLDLIARGASGRAPDDPGAPLSFDMLRSGVPLLPTARLQHAVLSGLDHAGDDLIAARTNIESWFNGSMDRVSGWYKRRTQVWLFAIGFAAAVLLNLDSLSILRRLQDDDTFRQAVVASAQTIIDTGKAKVLGQTPQQARDAIDNAGFPVGWRELSDRRLIVPTQLCDHPSGACKARSAHADELIGTLLLILLGWVITGAAATFGAPFWFDVLNKFMVIRSTVKPAQKSPDEASADATKQTPAVRSGDEAAKAAAVPTIMPPAALAAAPVGRPAIFQPETWRPGFVNMGEVDL